jgi:hypothetical protein
MGVAAARLVMVQDVDDEGRPSNQPPPPAGSALLPVLGLLGVTAARAAGWLPLNDPLTRGLLFVPLFIMLVMTLHRQTLAGTKGLASLLGHPFLVYLVSGWACLRGCCMAECCTLPCMSRMKLAFFCE